MPEPTPEAWAQIRHAYEHTDKPIVEICFEHEITAPMLRYRVKCWDWTRRKPFVPRHGPPKVAVTQASSPGEAQRNPGAVDEFAPDFAALHPGYGAPGLPLHPTPPAFADASAGDPPPPGEGQEKIVPQLQSAVARVLPAIEATIARLAAGAHHPRDMEQAGRALSALTRTLRELNALLAQHNAPLEPEDVPLDIDEFRFELARRIKALIEKHQNEDDAPPDQGAGPDTQSDALPAAAMDGPARA